MTASGNITVGLLVVGGGPAGHNAATAYREQGGDGGVLLVSGDDTVPYFRPSLSKKYLSAGSGEQERPLAPDGCPDGVEIRTGTEVVELTPDRHSARLSDGTVVEYRWCVPATGAAPVTLPIPGVDRVTHLRSPADARVLRERVRDGAPMDSVATPPGTATPSS